MNRLKLNHEIELGYPTKDCAGVDEVGRGCIAGPVCAAAVVLPEIIDLEADPWLIKITDSKRLSEAQREMLFPKIKAWAKRFSIAYASVEEIEKLNIYHASYLAMERALADVSPQVALIDGKALPKAKNCELKAVIKGDLNCLSIGCASILAKVARDRLMIEFDVRYPDYGFRSHKGYPTVQHQKALKTHGVLSIHRKGFGPVKTALTHQTEARI